MSTWDLLKTSGAWLVMSFFLCGILHAFLNPNLLHRQLGNKKVSSIVKATVSGMFLPVCSCGVVPLTLSLYMSGAYLGPTLAFLVATPIINPAAVLMSFAMLGPKITPIYIVVGFVLPLIIGLLGNRFAGNELISPVAQKYLQNAEIVPMSTTVEKTPLTQRILAGLNWGFTDLGVQTSRYMLVGNLFAAALLLLVPSSFIMEYLSSPKLVSIIGISILGAIMYVCALGHIPFIAALVSAGAAPGVAISFLLSGTATNLPEMISIWNLIGKRAVILYTSIVVIFSFLAGYFTNQILLDNFVPVFNISKNQSTINIANNLSFAFPEWFSVFSALIVIALGLYAWFQYLKGSLARRRRVEVR